MFRYILFVFFLFWIPFSISAEVVILITGKALEGVVTHEDNTSLTLKTNNGPQAISKRTIAERLTDEGFAKRVKEFIKLLGDDDWYIREKATKALQKLGPAVAPDLEIAAQNPDPEVVYRAKGLLSEMGLYYHKLSALWEDIAKEVKSEPPENWAKYFDSAKDHTARGNLKEVEKEYLRAIVLSKRLDNVSRQSTAQACFDLAGLYASRNNWQATIECYEEGLSRDPWHGDINYLLGEAYEKNGDRENALARYKISLRLDPNHEYTDQASKKIEQSSAVLEPKQEKEDLPIKQAQVVILPVSIKKEKDIRRLKNVASQVEKELGITVQVVEPVELLDNSLLVREKQYDASKLCQRLYKIYKERFAGEAVGLIGITNKDIGRTDCNYLFANTRAHAGILSYARMQDEFYGGEHNEDTLRRRLTAQLTTSIGRTVGLHSCNNPTCAMCYVGSLGELDKRTFCFCADCFNLFQGYVLGHLGKYDKAFRLIDAYIEKYTNVPAPHFRKGLLYWELNDWDAVIREFEMVLKLDPDNEAAQDNLERAKKYQRK